MKTVFFISSIKVLYYFFNKVISDSPRISTKIFSGLYIILFSYSLLFIVSFLLENSAFQFINQFVIFFPITTYLLGYLSVNYLNKNYNVNHLKISKKDKFVFIIYVFLLMLLIVSALWIAITNNMLIIH